MKRLLHFFGDRTVRSKLMLIYICIGFFPFLFCGVVFYKQVSSLLREEEDILNRDIARQSIQSMDTQLTVYNNLSDYLAFNQVISNTLSEEYDSSYDMAVSIDNMLDPFLSSLQYFHTDLSQVTIYCENIPVSHDSYLAPLSELEKQSWYQNMDLTTDITWSYDPETRLIFSARKMPGLQRNGVESVLYISLAPSALFAPFEYEDLDSYAVQIADSSGTTLFFDSVFGENTSYASYDETDFARVFNSPDSGTVSLESDVTDWTLHFYRINTETNQKLVLLAMGTLAAMAAAFLASIFALDRVSQNMITAPLQKLDRQMQLVEGENLEADLNPKYNDEIGSLTRSFSRMLERIQQLIQDLYVTKLQEKEYQLKALQHQINPHFLYNTLSMINFKALEVGEQDISRITLALSSFYRTCLNRGNDTCTLREELSNIKAYLEIQLMLHDYNFVTHIDIDDSLLDCITLNLILQPIVENAIEHGLDEIEDDRVPVLNIFGNREGDTIQILVEDNGMGIPQEEVDTILTSQSHGYGMRNVHERIRLFYGEKYGLSIAGSPGNHTQVMIIIPYISGKQGPEH